MNNAIAIVGETFIIQQYKGGWHEIDREEVGDAVYILLEHDELGDETCGLVIKEDGLEAGFTLLGETFDSLDIFLVYEGIINIDDLQ